MRLRLGHEIDRRLADHLVEGRHVVLDIRHRAGGQGPNSCCFGSRTHPWLKTGSPSVLNSTMVLRSRSSVSAIRFSDQLTSSSISEIEVRMNAVDNSATSSLKRALSSREARLTTGKMRLGCLDTLSHREHTLAPRNDPFQKIGLEHDRVASPRRIHSRIDNEFCVKDSGGELPRGKRFEEGSEQNIAAKGLE
jgi:hypothetical protein